MDIAARFRAPLLWLVLPLASGLIIRLTCPLPNVGPSQVLGGAAIASVLAWATARCPRIWAAVFVASGALLGFAIFPVEPVPPADWQTLPAREARLTLRIEQVFTPRFGADRLAGVGRIVDASPTVQELVGSRVAFRGRTDPHARPLVGAKIDGTGVLTPLLEAPEKGSFSAFLAAQGVYFELSRAQWMTRTSAPAWRRVFAQTSDRAAEILGAGLENRPRERGVLQAMVLGRRDALDPIDEARFKQSGTLHFFAISGLHVGIIAAALVGVLRVCRVPRRVSLWVGLGLLAGYVGLVGAPPSALRAFAMVAAVQVSWAQRRAANPLAALATAATIVLVVSPGQLFAVGFQLSYAIVWALLLLGLPLGQWALARTRVFASLPEADWGWPRRLADWARRGILPLIAIAAAISTISLPCSVALFGVLPLVAVPLNLVLVPLASLVLCSGLSALVCGSLGLMWGAAIFNHAAALLIVIMESCIRVALAIPGGNWSVEGATGPVFWIGSGLILGVIGWGYGRNWTRDARWFALPFALCALTLVIQLITA